MERITQRLLAIVGCLLGLVGCDQPQAVEPVGVGRHALRLETSDRDQYIMSARQPTEIDLVAIRKGDPLGYEWSRLDVPRGTSGQVDLADARADVVFTQNYRTECSRTEVSRPCWVQERYRAGDPGLKGEIQISLGAKGATNVGYFVYWEGMTDRFGLPEIWYSHGSESGRAFGAAVIERGTP